MSWADLRAELFRLAASGLITWTIPLRDPAWLTQPFDREADDRRPR